MANGPNFASLLDESPHEVSAPTLLPEGSYTFLVKMPRYDKSTKKGTEFTEFPMQPLAPWDDVNQEALATCLNGDAINDKELRLTFYHTDKSIYRLDEFHQHCGVDLETDRSSRRQRNENVVGCQVGGYVKHVESDTQPGRFFANIVKTMPVD